MAKHELLSMSQFLSSRNIDSLSAEKEYYVDLISGDLATGVVILGEDHIDLVYKNTMIRLSKYDDKATEFEEEKTE